MRYRNIALFFLSLSPVLAAAQQQPQQPAISFPQAAEPKAAGTKLHGLYDENSTVLRELAAGEILIARSEKAAWFEVEVPAGFACWVYAKYLDESGALGMAVVTDDRVNVRPYPSSDAKYFPIGKVSKGDQLRVLDHKGEWTQVQAPSSLRAWVKASALTLLGNPDQHAERIRAAEASAESQWKERLAALERQREEEKKRAEARAAFQKAENAFTKEKARAMEADFSQVRFLFAEAGEKGDAALKDQVKSRIETIDALENLIREKQGAAEIEKRAKELEQKVRGAKEKALEEATARTKFGDSDKLLGRYDGVGWLKRSLHVTKGFVYTLEKGGVTLFEIEDAAGRYSLADFAGCEIGVKGKVTRFPGATTQTVEVSKLEVIAAR